MRYLRGNCRSLRAIGIAGAVMVMISGCGGGSGGGNASGIIENDNPGQGSGGASFGVDLPTYQDLVLVSTRGTVFGLDGLILPTVKQTPVMRFANGTATRDLSNWINGQRSSLGSWQGGSSGNPVFTFGGDTLTSIAAPFVASRASRDYYHCYDKISTFSFDGVNGIPPLL